ncbi:hypothetical protein KR093_011244 [Drosophila rubida]|uniref:Protein kinase domain-containing protein n=1 Tax=Drosophila rubida TaxID=30044 RepID=A0AAD4K8P7_9MUSC|nr:hypothetical protein KR093_011244 [Drosophila rubida]
MHREVSIEEIKPYLSTPCIGKGTFGKVYKGTLDDGDVAIKVNYISKEGCLKVEEQVELMQKVQHAHIVDYIAHLILFPTYYLVLELMEGPSLEQLIHSRNESANNEIIHTHAYTTDEALQWLSHAAEGLAFLHGWMPSIIHRDVKPSNMLLDKNKKILKICDFGNMRQIGTNMTNESGTFRYMAPEVRLIDNR